MRGILGKKVGMTQLFDENGNVVPVTIVEALLAFQPLEARVPL